MSVQERCTYTHTHTPLHALLHTPATLMDAHVTQGRAITLVRHCLETPGRSFFFARSSGIAILQLARCRVSDLLSAIASEREDLREVPESGPVSALLQPFSAFVRTFADNHFAATLTANALISHLRQVKMEKFLSLPRDEITLQYVTHINGIGLTR